MFNLTKNHKGDILISGATNKYSVSWAISERPEAVIGGARTKRRATGLSVPTPAWPGQANSSLAAYPGNLRNLPSHHASPGYQKAQTLRRLIDHREICEMAVLFGFNKQQ